MASLIALVATIYGVTPFVLYASDADLPSSLFFDDFYYYVVIARNTLDGRFLSFDGLSTTNGYHPLWLFSLLALAAVFGTGFAFLAAVHSLATLLCGVAAAGTHRLLRDEGVCGPPRETVTFVVFLAALYVAAGAMEVVLAIPLIIWSFVLLRAWSTAPTPARSFWLFLIASAAVLTRLDAALLYFVVAIFLVVRSRLSDVRAIIWVMVSRANLLAALAGAFPVAAWAIVSLLVAGSVVPVSAAAKQLAPFPAARWDHFAMILANGWPISLLGWIVKMLGWVWVIAAVALFAQQGRRSPTSALEHGVMCFVPAYYFLFGLISAWGIWPWYFYPLVAAAPYAMARVLGAAQRLMRLRTETMSKATLILIGVLLARFAVDIHGRWFTDGRFGVLHTQQSRAIAAYAMTHPGRYAIGDRAGVPAYFMSSPVLQLEGLVGDGEFLDHVRARRDLLEVLRQYRVDYYVTFGAIERDGQCYVTNEPRARQAGDASPKMTGRFCYEPVFADVAHAESAALIFKVLDRE